MQLILVYEQQALGANGRKEMATRAASQDDKKQVGIQDGAGEEMNHVWIISALRGWVLIVRNFSFVLYIMWWIPLYRCRWDLDKGRPANLPSCVEKLFPNLPPPLPYLLPPPPARYPLRSLLETGGTPNPPRSVPSQSPLQFVVFTLTGQTWDGAQPNLASSYAKL